MRDCITAQAAAQHDIYKAVAKTDPPATLFSEREAVQELLRAGLSYPCCPSTSRLAQRFSELLHIAEGRLTFLAGFRSLPEVVFCHALFAQIREEGLGWLMRCSSQDRIYGRRIESPRHMSWLSKC